MSAIHAWHGVHFTDRAIKSHMVPGCLMPDLIADMRKRGYEPGPIVPSEHQTAQMCREMKSATLRQRVYSLDPGGMLHRDEPWFQIRVDNLPIDVRACTVRDYADALRSYAVRRFASGRAYYKIHGAWHCLVLLPRQFRAFLAALVAETPRAEAESAAFWRGQKTVDEVLREVNAAAIGCDPGELPRLAADRPGDRFTFPIEGPTS